MTFVRTHRVCSANREPWRPLRPVVLHDPELVRQP